MKFYRVWLSVVFLFLVQQSAEARFGLGAGGGIIYPGFFKSSVYKTQFAAGFNYDVFIHYDQEISGLDDRISYIIAVSNGNADTKLTKTGTTNFKFNYLNLDIIYPVFHNNKMLLKMGIGAALATISAKKYSFEVNDSIFIPQIVIRGEYEINRDFNLFLNSSFQSGTLNVLFDYSSKDELALHGLKMVFGATMFLTD